jgi:membrane protein implicated in regulation of membrane protease activity
VPVWLIWAIIAVLLGIGEMVTPGLFFLGPLALSAGAAALAGLFGGGTIVTLIVFILASLASLAFLRPIARRHIRMPSISRTGTDALVGRKAVVTRRIDSGGGRVRIGGEEWSARSYLDGRVLEEGQSVDVIEIEGATALVSE